MAHRRRVYSAAVRAQMVIGRRAENARRLITQRSPTPSVELKTTGLRNHTFIKRGQSHCACLAAERRALIGGYQMCRQLIMAFDELGFVASGTHSVPVAGPDRPSPWMPLFRISENSRNPQQRREP